MNYHTSPLLIGIEEGHDIAKKAATLKEVHFGWDFYKHYCETEGKEIADRRKSGLTSDEYEHALLIAFAFYIGRVQGIREERIGHKTAAKI